MNQSNKGVKGGKMTANSIVSYLEHPKVIGEFHGSTLDGMNKVEFSPDKLEY